MKKISILIICIFISLYSRAFSQNNENMQEIFVTGLSVPTEVNKAGIGITTITNKEIEEMKPNSLEEILRKVPGILIRENSAGKLVTLYVRGVSAGIALMVDGMPINDAAGINNDVDLSSVPIDNIERIEIIKGPAGASLGSSAMNGAINIITKKGGNKPVQASADIQSMLWKLNFKGSASVYGSKGIVDYRIGGSFFYDENISAAAEKYGNYEKDPDAMGSFNGYINIKPTDDISTAFQINYADRESDIDDGGGLADNLDYIQRTRRVNAAWNTKALFFDIWEPQLKINYTYSNRTYGSYEFLANNDNDIFEGNSLNIDFYNNIYILDELTLTAGINYEYNQVYIRNHIMTRPDEYQDYFNNENMNSYAGYLQATVNLFDAWTTVASFRVQKEGDTKVVPVWKVSTVYDIDKIDLQLKFNTGTGAKAPSLYQLYDPLNGNQNLALQESFAYEIGFENGLFNRKIVYGLSWFDDYYDNMISWKTNSSPSGGSFENEQNAHIRGIETFINIYPVKWLDIKTGYTWMQTFDYYGNPLERRPEHQFQAGFAVYPVKGLMIGADVIYNGESVSTMFDTKGYNDDYFLLNAVISYDINDNIQVYLKGKNLTNTEYEEISGYGTKGIEIFAGLKAKI